MKLISGAVITVVSAASLREAPRRRDDGFLDVAVSRKFGSTGINVYSEDTSSGLARRGKDGVDTEILNNASFYAFEFQLGTPPQPISLVLDTGSSDIWLPSPDACVGKKCNAVSTFDYKKSSTFTNNGTEFFTSYVDDTFALGLWAQDVARIGSLNVESFNFALANLTNSSQAVAGIGLARNEAQLQTSGTQYENLPMKLKAEGAIQLVAYSLWLNQRQSEAGSVLFGAIDYGKMKSDLYVMPMVPTSDKNVTEFAAQISGLSVYDKEGNEQPFAAFGIPAVFDSGSTYSSAPLALIEPFIKAIGAKEITPGYFVVECSSLTSDDGGMGLQIGGIDITIGFTELFAPFPPNSGRDEYCLAGFKATSDRPYFLLGDNILRSLYVVYDLENLEIGIAAAQTGDSATKISNIDVLSKSIPGTRAKKETELLTTFAVNPVTLIGSASKASGSHSAVSSLTSSKVRETAVVVTVPSIVQETIVIGAKKGSSGGNTAFVATGSLVAATVGFVLILL